MPATPRPSSRKKLPRRRILRARRFLDAAFSRGEARRITGAALSLLILKREDPAASAPGAEEVAFLVPKKLGCAAVRNRIRRRMREAYRLHFEPERERRLLWLAKAPAVRLEFPGLLAAMKDLHARSL
ncbi:MAG: ribonuclease P protein component [Verrucomicrobium sp.]|nr:ribonuclease P protein component [Verrucomicrobium sp.]